MDESLKPKRLRIPLRRKVYKPLRADPLVGVQPLLGPSGLEAYLKLKHGGHWKEEIQGGH